MPSASSSRYQSRLFNFFHRQSRQLKLKSDRAWGNLRVAATWVATVGLYPFYLLFQSTSSVAKINQAVQQSLPQLPANDLDYLDPPSTDIPIQRVLLAVDALSEEALTSTSQNQKPVTFWVSLVSNAQKSVAAWGLKFFSNSSHTSSLTQSQPKKLLTDNRRNIQGIATQLSSRTLVLITTQNQILDIFTQRQQQKLQEFIIDQVAAYWRSIEPSKRQTKLMLQSSKILAIIDRTVARLESKHLAPVVEVAITNLPKRGGNLVQQIKKITLSLSRNQLVGSKIAASTNLHDQITFNNFESSKFRLQTLIFAAINYFFGSHSSKVIATPNNSTQAKLRYQRKFKLPTAASTDLDPWLTLDDLFGEPELVGGSTAQHNASTPTVKQLTGTTKVILSNSARYSLGKLRDRFLNGRVLGQKTTQGRRANLESKQLSLPTSAEYPSASQTYNQRSPQNTQVEAKPDWIETNATTIGYVKHPLEKILEWLDRLILWLEEMLVRVLGRVQRVWQGK